MVVDASAGHGTIHHVELWVGDFGSACRSLGWLFTELGYEPDQEWTDGISYLRGPTYICIERSPARSTDRHDRLRAGMNHLAFHVASRSEVDRLVEDAGAHGWRLMFPEDHPYAGGSGHYAAYLEDDNGFEVELVALPDH